MASDATQFDTDCGLMLHCDGTDGSTTFTDSSYSPTKTVTANGNAQIDTAQSKFGGASGLFDGTGDFLSVPANSDFDLGTGDFTIDCWVRFNALPADGNLMTFITRYTSGSYAVNGSYLFFIDNSGGTYRLSWESYDGADITINRTWSTPSTGVWYHLTVIRTGTTIRMFVDGTQLGADGTDGHNLTQSTSLYVGADSAANYVVNGWIDELRIVKGTAVWTANFTSPSAAYVPANEKTFSEQITLADTFDKAFGYTVSANDLIALTDTFSRLYSASLSFTDIVTLSEIFDRIFSGSISITDLVTMLDTFDTELAFARTFSDIESLLDTSSQTYTPASGAVEEVRRIRMMLGIGQ